MSTSFQPCLSYFVMVALWAVAGACSVSDSGLGTPPDGSTGGANGAWCPAGLTEQASWPAKTSSTSCSRPCGPDGLGVQTCSQTDRATCQSQPGCVCLEAPCVVCATCTFTHLPDCYAPTNTTSIPLCVQGVARGATCSPACGKHLCLEADGMTGCVCNGQGKYACADWGDSGWQ